MWWAASRHTTLYFQIQVLHSPPTPWFLVIMKREMSRYGNQVRLSARAPAIRIKCGRAIVQYNTGKCGVGLFIAGCSEKRPCLNTRPGWWGAEKTILQSTNTGITGHVQVPISTGDSSHLKFASPSLQKNKHYKSNLPHQVTGVNWSIGMEGLVRCVLDIDHAASWRFTLATHGLCSFLIPET